MLRRTLDALYLTAGYLAAVFLAAIGVTIVAQVVGRMVGLTIDSTEIAGFCLAASTFLGLAYTLRHGGHIRVTLLIRYASGTVRQWIELWCIGFAAAGMAYFTFWAFEFVYYSWIFRELSPGLMAVPFWIPRLGMATGLLLLTLALVDEFVAVWRGAVPSYEANAETVLGDDDVPPPAKEARP